MKMLAAIVVAATNEKWLDIDSLAPGGFKDLVLWLRKQHYWHGGPVSMKLGDKGAQKASRRIREFVDELFCSREIIDADIGELAPEIMRVFATAVARKMDERLGDNGAVSAIFKSVGAAAKIAFDEIVAEKK